MARTLGQVVDRFATEPVRASAVLRLPLIALMYVLVNIWDVDLWLPDMAGNGAAMGELGADRQRYYRCSSCCPCRWRSRIARS